MDYKRQIDFYKQIEDKFLPKIDLFSDDKDALFFYRKCERIASAFYLVTDFIKDIEPVKRNIRNLAIKLSNESIGTNFSRSLEEKKKSIELITVTLLRASSLLEIARSSGLISDMNFAVLKGEILELVRLLEKKVSVLSEGGNMSLKREFFEISDVGDKGQSDQASGLSKSTDSGLSQPKRAVGPLVNSSKLVSNDFTKSRKAFRRDTIINALKQRSGLTVGDFRKVVIGCSEKTIQRELVYLIKSKMIKKEGERRWSKYSLAL